MSRSLAFGRLVRIPNLFTALSDVCIGLIVVREVVPTVAWFTIPMTSGCLYMAGMVWNDYFDRHRDAIERPARPIPSGQIAPETAVRFGILLITLALISAGITGAVTTLWRPVLLAIVLTVLILAYDAGARGPWRSPVLLGACRFLNVLMGFSVGMAVNSSWEFQIAVAGIVGLYVAGVTVAARNEAAAIPRSQLGLGVAMSALALMGSVLIIPSEAVSGMSLGYYFVALLAVGLMPAAQRMLSNPDSQSVQHYVKQALLGVIMLDASLATLAAGPPGLLIILLLIPAAALGRRVYST